MHKYQFLKILLLPLLIAFIVTRKIIMDIKGIFVVNFCIFIFVLSEQNLKYFVMDHVAFLREHQIVNC